MMHIEILQDCGCIPVINLVTTTKTANLVKWRQIYAYYLVHFFGWTLQSAADVFRQDHATVMYSSKRVENLREFDKTYHKELLRIEHPLNTKYKHEMNYRAYFAIESKLKSMGFKDDRAYLIDVFTSGKKDSLKALTPHEYIKFITWLKSHFKLKERRTELSATDNRMRQKLWVLFVRKMSFSQNKYEQWVISHGKFHKPIAKHTHGELVALLGQAELVYASWLLEVKKVKVES